MEDWFSELLHFPANVGNINPRVSAPCPKRAKPLALKKKSVVSNLFGNLTQNRNAQFKKLLVQLFFFSWIGQHDHLNLQDLA